MALPDRIAFATLASMLLLGACGGEDAAIPTAPAVSVADPPTYSVSGTMTGLEGTGLILVNNGGERLPVSSNGPFRFTISLASGNAYAVKVQNGPRSPLQTCEVTNGSGPIATADITNVGITCDTRVFAYVRNPVDNTVAILRQDRQSGNLTVTETSPYYALGKKTAALVIEPSGKYGYSVDEPGKSFHALRIDERTGEIAYAGSLATGAAPNRLAMDPLGRFIYVINSLSVDLSIVSIRPAMASFGSEWPPTQIGGFPFSGTARDLIVDPTGRFLYIAFGGFEQVEGYEIDQAMGHITQIAGSPFPIVGTPSGIAMDRTGHFLYTVNASNATISAFSRNGVTGALAPLAGSPFAAPAGACAITVHPASYVLVASRVGASATLSTFAKSANGSLTQVHTVPVSAGAGSCSIAIDATERFVYIANEVPGNVSGYSLDAMTGQLTQLPASPFATGRGVGAASIVFR